MMRRVLLALFVCSDLIPAMVSADALDPPGALREIGLPEGDIPLALFPFNVGVELGQILFIAVVLAIGVAAGRLFPAVREQAAVLTRVSSYAIGSMAAFWVISRIAAF